MSGQTKKIIVNLDVVKHGKMQKTRKMPPSIVPPISPNHLKNELLNKIKYHKNKIQSNEKTTENNTDEFTDEFCKSIDYLNSVKKKTMESTAKKHASPYQNSIKTKTTAHTLKNNAQKYVQMDLPEELMETPFPQVTSSNVEPMALKPRMLPQPSINYQSLNNVNQGYKIDNDVPYGCLKNGIKEGYRNWKLNQTRKNTNFYSPTTETNSNMTMNMDTNVNANNINLNKNDDPMSFHNEGSKLHRTNEAVAPIMNNVELRIHDAESRSSIINENFVNVSNKRETKQNIEASPPPQKRFIKKTTIKKHTLGKSTKYRKVGILIKNKTTRKNILNAYKELKKTSMPDIKKYLKNHGMIKVGSTAPNDVLRETYESSILAGEITNQNSEVLLHNFINDKE